MDAQHKEVFLFWTSGKKPYLWSINNLSRCVSTKFEQRVIFCFCLKCFSIFKHFVAADILSVKYSYL